jgi:hypothetical protein
VGGTVERYRGRSSVTGAEGSLQAPGVKGIMGLAVYDAEIRIVIPWNWFPRCAAGTTLRSSRCSDRPETPLRDSAIPSKQCDQRSQERFPLLIRCYDSDDLGASERRTDLEQEGALPRTPFRGSNRPLEGQRLLSASCA